MTEDEKSIRRSLEEEYKILQAKWDDFDKRALTIRGWFIAGSAAAISLSFNVISPALPVGLIIVTLTIWVIEGVWKSWQHAYGSRIMFLEEFFRGNGAGAPNPYQIHTAWNGSYSVIPGKSINWKKVIREVESDYIAIAYAPPLITFLSLAILKRS